MVASDLHLEILIWLLQTLKAHFAQMPDVYVSGDILTYYTEGAENAETRAAQETIARQKAEEELERLREQLMSDN
jgi:hypothetical protein